MFFNIYLKNYLVYIYKEFNFLLHFLVSYEKARNLEILRKAIF